MFSWVGRAVAADVAGELEDFCTMWMGFLQVRERDNRAVINWQVGPDGVRGEFVGYSKEYECRLKNSKDPKATPVATIKYHEYRYRHSGPSTSEALERSPTIVENTEVLEIFRYGKGKWIY